MSKAGSVQAGRDRTHGGLSHSWERPTRESPAPRAQTISVPLARSEITRMVILLGLSRLARMHRPQDLLLPGFRCHSQIIRGLQIQPELGRGVEVPGQTKCGI